MIKGCQESPAAYTGSVGLLIMIHVDTDDQRADREPPDPDDQALAWIARLRSDASGEEDRQAFALWLAHSEGHRKAMDAALELWEELDCVRHLPTAPVERPAANQARWWSVAAMAASLVIGLFLWSGAVREPHTHYLQTAFAERRLETLADGSRVQLNANSRVSVQIGRDQRLLRLVRGEAFFEVAPDPNRPFHVDTNTARVTAIGTAFNVRLDGEDTTVTVSEGVVRVTERLPPGAGVPDSETLRRDQSLEASGDGLHSAGRVVPEVLLAWRRGELVAREMPLPRLLGELKRYHDLDVLISDPEVAAMTVSGVFQLDEPDAILHALEVSHGLRLTPLPDSPTQLLSLAR